MPLRLDVRSEDFAGAFASLLATKRETAVDVDKAVSAIIDDVRGRGDEALVEYTRRFDDDPALTASRIRVSAEEVMSAEMACDTATLAALALAAERIALFHQRQKPQDLEYRDAEGVQLGYRWTPIAAVGLYVPGGTAAYPSSVLMNAIPARVAGVERLAMVVPAPGGAINPLVLTAAKLAGIDEIYRVGGAQAIAALAYGTESIAPVDKIVGPGNAYVAAAKRRVFGQVGIDMIAGPSEVLIVADARNDASWIAADLLAQAEHDEAAQSILITDDADFADAVADAVESHLRSLPRQAIARKSWERYGAILIVADLEDALPLIDQVAPEHLQLAIDDADRFVRRVRHAGSIFLGRFTPEALGDYVAGPNHVLPTGRSARFSSGLGVTDFMKRSTFLGCDSDALAALGPAAARLAEAEGLGAHARSITIRLNR
jgi:histidinol dehydrogenase